MSERPVSWLSTLGSVLALGFLFATSASADPIVIASGSLIWTGTDTGRMTLASSSGSLSIDAGGGLGYFAPWATCSVPECGSGSTIPLTAIWGGNDLSGTAIYNGTGYRLGGLTNDSAQADLRWTGALALPPNFAGGTLQSPFSFTGMFGYPGQDLAWNQLGLTGSGTATLTFSPYATGIYPGAFIVTAARYDFARPSAPPSPTPEPASLVLLGSGLVAALGALWRRGVAALY